MKHGFSVWIALGLIWAAGGCGPGEPPPPAVLTKPATLAGGAALPLQTSSAPIATPAPVWMPSPTAALPAQPAAPTVTPTVTPILVTALPAVTATPTPLPEPTATAAAITLSIGGLVAVLPPMSPPGAEPPATAHLENGFLINYLGTEDHGDGSSTWRYRVERLEGAKKLQVWGLALPDCVEVLDAAPEGWEIAHAEDAPGAWGVSWKTKGNFQHGEFAVTLRGSVQPGTVAVAAIGPKLAAGAIAGPHCP